jgi:hypothetical protein
MASAAYSHVLASTYSLLKHIADQIEASEERCVAAEASEQQADLYVFTSREAIRHSLDQLARIAATERLPVSICRRCEPIKAAKNQDITRPLRVPA